LHSHVVASLRRCDSSRDGHKANSGNMHGVW
jgi:hypothetical protein